MFSINLVFVNAKTMRRLNKEYRQKDKATTVLSFYYGDRGQAKFPSVPQEKCLGEIIICPAEAKKQNLSIESLVVHGLKNLLPQISTAKLQRT